jgi:hypothetical protein
MNVARARQDEEAAGEYGRKKRMHAGGKRRFTNESMASQAVYNAYVG